MDEIGVREGCYGLGRMQDRSMAIVVGSEEEKRDAEQFVRTLGQISHWRRAFAVEIEVGPKR